MKVSLQSGNVVLEAVGENHLELFEQLSSLQEVFQQDKCGKCGNANLKFVVRKVQDGKKEYKYPEIRCSSPKCLAKLTFGGMEGGALFPVRFEREDGAYKKDANDKLIPRGSWGWVKYNKETGKEE